MTNLLILTTGSLDNLGKGVSILITEFNNINNVSTCFPDKETFFVFVNNLNPII